MSREVMTRTPVSASRRIPYGPDPSQFFDLYEPPAKPIGLAVNIHGGFWRSRFDLTHASHLCNALAKTGILAANLEYRRAGETGGGWPVTFQDIQSALQAVRKTFPTLGDPIVLGHSAGGHLALLLATKLSTLKGVIACGPVACLELAHHKNLGSGAVAEFMGGTPEQLPAQYAAADPVRHTSSVRRILVHGTQDDIVPLEISRAFLEARQTDKGMLTLLEIPGGDHFDPIDPQSAAWPLMETTAKGLLGSKEPR